MAIGCKRASVGRRTHHLATLGKFPKEVGSGVRFSMDSKDGGVVVLYWGGSQTSCASIVVGTRTPVRRRVKPENENLPHHSHK